MTKWLVRRLPSDYPAPGSEPRVRVWVVIGLACSLGGMVEMIQAASVVGFAAMATLSYTMLTALDIVRRRTGPGALRMVRTMEAGKEVALALLADKGSLSLLEVLRIEDQSS